MSASSKAVVVLGMHRSGTSAVTGTLHRLGVALGSNLMPAIPGDNDRGFYESNHIVPINERLFAAVASSWDDPAPLLPEWWRQPAVASCRTDLAMVLDREFRDEPLWGVKDPRICRLMPLWLDVLAGTRAEARFLIIWRHPFEVAESLLRRHGFARAKSYMLWFQHMRDAEVGSRGTARRVLSYAGFLDDWRSAVREAAAALTLPDLAARVERDGAAVDAFLSVDLHRHRADDDRFAVEAPAFCHDLLALLAAATGTDATAQQDALDRAYERFDAWLAGQQPWPDLAAGLRHRLLAANAALDEGRHQAETLRALTAELAAAREGLEKAASMAMEWQSQLATAERELEAVRASLAWERKISTELAARVDSLERKIANRPPPS
jgi:hypothetical protein